MSVITKPFTKIATALAVTTSLSGCLGNMDPYAATAAGAALGYGLGQEVNDSWGGYAGGAIGGALANAAIKTAQRCSTTTGLDRNAARDNTTGRVTYDQTTQSQSGTCTEYGSGGVAPTTLRPIF